MHLHLARRARALVLCFRTCVADFLRIVIGQIFAQRVRRASVRTPRNVDMRFFPRWRFSGGARARANVFVDNYYRLNSVRERENIMMMMWLYVRVVWLSA